MAIPPPLTVHQNVSAKQVYNGSVRGARKVGFHLRRQQNRPKQGLKPNWLALINVRVDMVGLAVSNIGLTG